MPISLRVGDITRAETDAIVNAANSSLFAGGGVSGAIHRAGGPAIAEECRAWTSAHGPVPTGGAAVTGGGKLAARFVIHAVGPVYSGGGSGEAELLARAYRSAMEAAEERRLTSIAFPSISTGIFGYPVAEAARIAVAAVGKELLFTEHVRDAVFFLFDQETRDGYERALAEAAPER